MSQIKHYHSRGVEVIKAGQVNFIQGYGNCSMMHLIDGRKVCVTKTLSKMSAIFTPFIRTHKSFLINEDQIRSIHYDQGLLKMHGDQEIPISRRRSQDVKSILNYG